MRARKEIEELVKNNRDPRSSYLEELIIEILLDIRDLFKRKRPKDENK